MEDRLIEIQNLIAEMSAQQKKQQEKLDDLFEDINVMMKPLLSHGIEQMQALEEKGYFQFLNGLKPITDNIVGHYSQQELAYFANSVGMILDTARSLTQPDVLTLVNNISHTLRTADRVKPIGIWGLMKATSDKDVSKGLAIVMELLKQLGQVKLNAEALPPGSLGTTNLEHEHKKTTKNKLESLLAPKRKVTTSALKPSTISKSTSAAATTGLTTSTPIVPGYVFTSEGFLENPGMWSEDLATQIAKALGVEELSEVQWKLVNFARNEYLKTKATPNMRALSVGSGVSTKEIYTAFPHSPAKTIAKIAGISKPVGCI